ncbi:MAG: translation elongation factor Ts [Anaerolineae bacterium]|nr:translation elongation factor Ts [Anaerolineae bacterium]
MATTAEMVKELRQATGAGVLDCRKALEACAGDIAQAADYLRKKGLAAAEKKAGRAANEGTIGSYIHTGSRLAALVELNCETDFVARTDEFQELAHDLAMQVVAASPRWISAEDVPTEVVDIEKDTYRREALAEGKSERIVDRIIEGRLAKFYDQYCLLRQPYFRDPDITIADLIKQKIAQLGENIVVRRFVRFEVGGSE